MRGGTFARPLVQAILKQNMHSDFLNPRQAFHRTSLVSARRARGQTRVLLLLFELALASLGFGAATQSPIPQVLALWQRET